MTIGEELKKAREAKKLSLRQLSIKANVSDSYLSAIERGIKSPTLEFLSKINKALDYSLLAAIMAYYDKEQDKLIDKLIKSSMDQFGIKEINKYKEEELKDSLKTLLNEELISLKTGLPKGAGLIDGNNINEY